MADFTQQFYSDYKIGHWTYGKPDVLSWGEGTTLEIGAFCSITSGVKIFLGEEHRIDWIISNDVWIGVESVILSGIKIGDGAVVGTKSVVTQSIPPYAIVFGNPANILRYRFDQETINKLLEIAWWNWDDKKIVEFLPYLLNPDIRDFVSRAISTA